MNCCTHLYSLKYKVNDVTVHNTGHVSRRKTGYYGNLFCLIHAINSKIMLFFLLIAIYLLLAFYSKRD